MDPSSEEGADELFVPVNYQPLSKAMKEPEPVPAALGGSGEDEPEPDDGGDETPDEEDGDNEEKSARALALAHVPAFADAFERVGRKEARTIAQFRKKFQGDDYAGWFAKFQEDHVGAVRTAVWPAAVALAGAIWTSLGGEASEGFDDVARRHTDNCAAAYVKRMSAAGDVCDAWELAERESALLAESVLEAFRGVNDGKG